MIRIITNYCWVKTRKIKYRLTQSIPFHSLFSLWLWGKSAQDMCMGILWEVLRHLFQPSEFKDKCSQPREGLVNDLRLISKKEIEFAYHSWWNLCTKWMDEDVSVISYQNDGKWREENTSRLNTSNQLADYLLDENLNPCLLDPWLTRSSPPTQYLVMMSMRVRGMVKVQSRRSERARMAMKMFRVVRRTCINIYTRIKSWLGSPTWRFGSKSHPKWKAGWGAVGVFPYLIRSKSKANAHIADEAHDYD